MNTPAPATPEKGKTMNATRKYSHSPDERTSEIPETPEEFTTPAPAPSQVGMNDAQTRTLKLVPSSGGGRNLKDESDNLAYARFYDTTGPGMGTEVIRRFNAFPSLQAENKRLREALEKVEIEVCRLDDLAWGKDSMISGFRKRASDTCRGIILAARTALEAGKETK